MASRNSTDSDADTISKNGFSSYPISVVITIDAVDLSELSMLDMTTSGSFMICNSASASCVKFEGSSIDSNTTDDAKSFGV